MSVPKGKRSKSKVEFEMIYFKLSDSVDNLVEKFSFRDGDILDRNRMFLNIVSKHLIQLSFDVLYNIKVANSIYILTCIQRVMIRLRVPDDRYTEDVKNVVRMINSLKAWRKSDNKMKINFE